MFLAELRQNFAKTCFGSPLYLSPEIVNQEPQLGDRDEEMAHFCHLTVLTLMEEMKVFRLKFSEHSRHSRHSSTCALNFSRYSFASDVWSYGVTIYEAAMLVPPFRGANICQAGIKVDQSLSKSLHTTVS